MAQERGEGKAYWQQRAISARARGDSSAERIALGELALIERLGEDYDRVPGCDQGCPDDCMADHAGEL